MHYGLQTHFDARIPAADLEAVRGFGFGWCRLDAQAVDVPTMQTMIADVEGAGLRPLTILYDLDRLEAVPPGRWVEWGNELDFTTPPREYRDSLAAAAALGALLGIPIVAPCISNLDLDSLRWCDQVRGKGWPAGVVGISVHRYGDGTFDWSHPGFRTREDEVVALRQLCDGRPYLVTEFGYKTGTGAGFVTEADQAAYITQEWAFWLKEGARAAFLYQLNDGPTAEEGFGIRRCEPDGTLIGWKPAAWTVPVPLPLDGDPL